MTLKYVILTNQFERHTVQSAIFMAFLDPPFLSFSRHCDAIPQPPLKTPDQKKKKTPDHYLGTKGMFKS